MTEIYERDLKGMKYAILKSPFHTKVVRECAGMLEIPPMNMRRILIENLDMMMLESIGARYESWFNNGGGKDGFTTKSGSLLFSRYIPLIPEEVMKRVEKEVQTIGTEDEKIKRFRKLVYEEIKS